MSLLKEENLDIHNLNNSIIDLNSFASEEHI